MDFEADIEGSKPKENTGGMWNFKVKW